MVAVDVQFVFVSESERFKQIEIEIIEIIMDKSMLDTCHH